MGRATHTKPFRSCVLSSLVKRLNLKMSFPFQKKKKKPVMHDSKKNIWRRCGGFVRTLQMCCLSPREGSACQGHEVAGWSNFSLTTERKERPPASVGIQRNGVLLHLTCVCSSSISIYMFFLLPRWAFSGWASALQDKDVTCT